jgi:hypothetical protein
VTGDSHATLGSLAAPYFEADESVTGRHGVRYGRWSYLFTMASMVIVVNSVAGGATVALVFALAIMVASPVPVVLGIVAGLALLAAGLYYEHRRLTPVVLGSRQTAGLVRR